MYLEFYKFKKSPFHITPDPDFLFLSPSHKEASASIFYGIETRKGFLTITGEVGVGKTTILRSYLEGIDPEKIRIVYIFNAALSFDGVLKQICSEFGLKTQGEDLAEKLDTLFHYLIGQYREDRNVVLIIDEAQNMPVETLERLRMLSNLETSQDKLIQIILVGQPEFEARLELPELRQLKQRIAIRSRIEALTVEESISYIQHRLMRASSFHNPVFTPKALQFIVKKAGGIPRTINILCDNALVTGFGYQKKPVDRKIVKEVVGDFSSSKPHAGSVAKTLCVPVLVACLGAVFLFFNLSMPKFLNVQASKSLYSSSDWRKVAPAGIKQQSGGEIRKPFAAAVETVKSGNAGGSVPEQKKESEGPGVVGGVDEAPKAQVRQTDQKTTPSVGAVVNVMKKSEAGLGVKSASAGPLPVKSLPAASAASGVDCKQLPAKKKSATDTLPAKPAVEISQGLVQPQTNRFVVVKRGDNVSKLLVGFYGTVSSDMLASFKKLNPEISDINRITVGEKIFLP